MQCALHEIAAGNGHHLFPSSLSRLSRPLEHGISQVCSTSQRMMRHQRTAGTMPHFPSFLSRYSSSGTISVDVVLLATSLQLSSLLCRTAMASRGCQGGSCVSSQNNCRWEGRTCAPLGDSPNG